MLTINKLIAQGRGLAPVLLRRAAHLELDWDVRQKSVIVSDMNAYSHFVMDTLLKHKKRFQNQGRMSHTRGLRARHFPPPTAKKGSGRCRDALALR